MKSSWRRRRKRGWMDSRDTAVWEGCGPACTMRFPRREATHWWESLGTSKSKWRDRPASPSLHGMPDAPPTTDTVHADIGIVYATALELAPLFDRCEKVRKYVAARLTYRGARLGEIRLAGVQCGMGPAR